MLCNSYILFLILNNKYLKLKNLYAKHTLIIFLDGLCIFLVSKLIHNKKRLIFYFVYYLIILIKYYIF